jgi:hypothetical protein
MTETVTSLVAKFEGIATKAHQAEMSLRKQFAGELARLERERAYAFRRVAFVRLLAESTADKPTEEEAVTAQCRALSEELGWDGTSKVREAILDSMGPLARSIWQSLHQAGPEAPVETTLDQFETWFRHNHEMEFYALFDQYVPEAPLVDF